MSSEQTKHLLQVFEKILENSATFKPDEWQKRVLEHDGSITIRAGRQVGKSKVISLRAVQFALKFPGTTTLIIAASQRQSSLLFEKVRSELDDVNDVILKEHAHDWQKIHASRRKSREARMQFEAEFGIYDELPTLTKVTLKNGSVIYSLPAGKTGYFIRGFTVDHLICDEAAYIPETVWVAVRPMIAVSKQERGLGWTTLLSTPFGKGGYFYESFTDNEFLHIHASSENCRRIPRDFLTKEKARLTRAEYAQEYLGEFIDEYHQFFSSELIKRQSKFMEWDGKISRMNKYYLGVDIARYGEDENAFIVLEIPPEGNYRIIKVDTTKKRSLTDTVGRILTMNELFKFQRIFTDDTGIGGGVTDMLIEKLSYRIVGINNASRSVDTTGKSSKILKEDLYSNALMLLERDKVDLLNDLGMQRSLKCIQYEYTSDRKLRISGNYSHICEAFVRACWANKAKGLNLFIY